MRFLTVDQMRAADRDAVTEAGIPERALMRRAGEALACAVARVAARRRTRAAVLVAGHGNNGGDACVAARALREAGFLVRVLLTAPVARFRGVAREAWEAMDAAGVPWSEPEAAESACGGWTEDNADAVAAPSAWGGVVVDGVLGTGCAGAPSGAAARAIGWINRQRAHAMIVAADIPSGVHGDSGEAAGVAVHADVTVTFARPKRGLLNPCGAERFGHVIVADIGLPDALCDRGTDDAPCECIALPELARFFPRRQWSAHKGTCGHVAVIGGAAGMPGAPVLAALGAVRSGAGLVSLAVPPQSAAVAAAWVPEAMCHTLDVPRGVISPHALAAGFSGLDACKVVIAGPGLTRHEEAGRTVAQLLETGPDRLLLDADGLNALADLFHAGWRPRARQDLLLTPHPGEAARLLGLSVAAVEADRVAAVRLLAERYRAVVVLKGAGTLVCAPDGRPWLNRTGNPGMASGGMGDLLAGMVAALWAQGLDPVQAACTAVWAHGAAGDEAAWEEGRTALSATRLAAALGSVYGELERLAAGSEEGGGNVG
ncbi:MAG TPA: NAD(P)H-hydrate dehydratase [Kiritimatiellia bacterium]|jgi:NAD(P)H-hydrate epimerase|nr:NAD(P)H-hydrate dehydratase [Kiritimatiellia bacterium]HPW74719.1 NAD(P)H-hydrate dehydratase [Kiritimatiellia bacterium]HRU19265.1 NAD(P)H-hydrate dehydratase [Kiritimatiellia bacterium]